MYLSMYLPIYLPIKSSLTWSYSNSGSRPVFSLQFQSFTDGKPSPHRQGIFGPAATWRKQSLIWLTRPERQLAVGNVGSLQMESCSAKASRSPDIQWCFDRSKLLFSARDFYLQHECLWVRKTQRLLKTPGRACEWAIFCTGDNRPFGCLVAVVAWDQWNLDSTFNKFQVFTWYLLFSGFNMFQFQLVHCISHISQDCQALSPFPRLTVFLISMVI